MQITKKGVWGRSPHEITKSKLSDNYVQSQITMYKVKKSQVKTRPFFMVSCLLSIDRNHQYISCLL